MPATRGKHILIIDDDEDIRFTVRMVLEGSYQVDTLGDPLQIEKYLQTKQPDLVLLDMNFRRGDTSGKEGFTYLERLKQAYPDLPVILITAYGDIPLAVKGMKKGAADFVTKPWEDEVLLKTVAAAINGKKSGVKHFKEALHTEGSFQSSNFFGMVSESVSMKAVQRTLQKVAPTMAEVLILGENGTGKELTARAVHLLSTRADGPFVKVDLGAIPENLFESELFGHKKGAFTDAREDREGRFEMAQGGTLFLDEIGNLAPALQAKLLSVLQNRQVFRVGENQPRRIDVRLICATNLPLNEMAAKQDAELRFRKDLLYRINTVEIQLPPLRERRMDIAILAQHFLEKFAAKYGKGELSISKEAQQKLKAYDWPGNIRELEHLQERAVIMTENKQLQPDDFPLKPTESTASSPENYNLEAMEKEAIQKAIDKHRGNMTQVARELGMGRTTLYRRMQKYGL